MSKLSIYSTFMENSPISLEKFDNWLNIRRKELKLTIERIPIDKCSGWYHDKNESKITHESGKFFSIYGLEIEINFPFNNKWEQIIIDQPEIGILGILSKIINGQRYFLMQAKIEPGNKGSVQISPTLQATKSNYTKVHAGSTPLYLDYFTEKKGKVLIDQLQPEQAGRFMHKRNRNMIIEVNDEIDVDENFYWLTMGQLKELSKRDNLINMDSRTVISCLNFFNSHEDYLNIKSCNSSDFLIKVSEINFENRGITKVLSWLGHLKCNLELKYTKTVLEKMKHWTTNSFGIFNKDISRFNLEYFSISADGREVSSWSQPLISDSGVGFAGFIMNQKYELLFQAKCEVGAIDGILLYPSISKSKVNYEKDDNSIKDLFINVDKSNVIIDSIQSEEGGRFYQISNRNKLIKVNEDFSIPENFIWLNFFQIFKLMEFGYISIEARSIIGLINYKDL